MKISLNRVMPLPLASIKHGEASIWGSEVLLAPGEKVMLNAASGKGKSTFTNTLFGLRRDYTGTITFDEKDIKKLTVDQWTDIRLSKLSVVFQDLQLFPNLTVKENLLLKNNLTNTFTEQQVKNYLAELGLEDKWEQKCGLLSMGQQQRVAIIRALAQPYEYMILDEPFSHLDKKNAQLCLNLINDRSNQLKAGFVLTTLGDHHDFEYDKVLYL